MKKKTENKKYLEERLNVDFDSLNEFPLYVQVETINYCNAKCTICPIHNAARKKGNMSEYLFYRIIDELKENACKVRRVTLNLDGEPLLDKNIFKRVKQVKDIGIKEVMFATNGSLLHKNNNIEQLLDSGLDKVYLSIDGLTKETYENIRRGLQFNTVVNNIKQLIEVRKRKRSMLKIRLQMILNNDNLAEFTNWKKFWKSELESEDELIGIKMHNWGSQLKPEKNISDHNNLYPCVSPFGTLVILWDGRVCLCCADYECKLCFGNIQNESIKDVWQSSYFRKIRKDFLDNNNKIDMCFNCNVWQDEKKYEEE